MKEHVTLAPLNKEVGKMKRDIVHHLSGESKSCKSYDYVRNKQKRGIKLRPYFVIQSVTDLPPHDLNLKNKTLILLMCT